jgi:uncharacterized protein YoxC
MIIPVQILEIMVTVAVAVSAVAPIVLIVLFIRDLIRGELW